MRLLPLIGLALVLQSGAGAVRADLLDDARAKLSALQSGKSPKSEPVTAVGAVEPWGEPMPSRGDETQERSAARLQRKDTGEIRPAALSRLQRADERRLDDRERDERFADPRQRAAADAREAASAPRKQSAGVARAELAEAEEAQPVAVKRAPERRRSADERYYAARGDAAEEARPTARASSCANVARAWEGAAALASQGQEQRAYDAYLRLLSSCTDNEELLGTVFQAQKHLGAEALEQLMGEPVMAAPKLQAALFTLKLQRMYAANKARDAKAALAFSRDIRAQVLQSNDAGALEVSGWLEQRERNPKPAEQLFRLALRADRDADGARQGLVFALLAQNKVDAASREAERLDGAGADEIRAEVLLAQARAALQGEEFAEALKKLDLAERLGLEVDEGVLETRAWALKGVGKNAQAAKLFLPLAQEDPSNPDLTAGLVATLSATQDYAALQRLSSEDGALGRAAAGALATRLESQGRRVEAARLRGERIEGDGSQIGGSVAVRSKSGDAGGGRLKESIFPTVNGRFAVTQDAQLTVKGERIEHSDGVRSSRGHEARVGVQTRIDDLVVAATVGVSKVANSTKPTLEATARQYTDGGYIEAGVRHEPVRDSVRSYSGVQVSQPVRAAAGKTPENRTVTVGRVFDTYAYVGGSTVLDAINRYKLNWTLGGGSVQGENTFNNGYYKASVGVMKDIEHERFSWLSVGPYLNVSSYERDENRFEGSFGGYFSPKSDVGLGLALNAMTREGNTSLYKLAAQTGYVSRGLYYGNDSGMSVEGGGEAAWLLSPHVIVGTGVTLRTSPGYTDVALRFGLTVPFEARSKLYGSDLSGFRAQ